jgi:hypothetical protein
MSIYLGVNLGVRLSQISNRERVVRQRGALQLTTHDYEHTASLLVHKLLVCI